MNFNLMNCFRVLGLGVLGCSPIMATAKNLTTYQQLSQALNQGGNVSAIVQFDKCTLLSSDKSDSMMHSAATTGASTRLNFTIFSQYKVKVDAQTERMAIATSLTILTEHSFYGMVYAYSRLRVFEDNSAEYRTAYYDPRSYELKSGAHYRCKIDQGNGEDAITLFTNS